VAGEHIARDQGERFALQDTKQVAALAIVKAG
jgi:hypothetical protein